MRFKGAALGLVCALAVGCGGGDDAEFNPIGDEQVDSGQDARQDGARPDAGRPDADGGPPDADSGAPDSARPDADSGAPEAEAPDADGGELDSEAPDADGGELDSEAPDADGGEPDSEAPDADGGEPDSEAPDAEPLDGGDEDAAVDSGIDTGVIGDCRPGETRPCGPEQEIGACRFGAETCSAEGEWGECEGAVLPSEEICDGIDNDCKNGVDDGLGEIPSDNVQGACAGNVKFCYGANGYVDKPTNYVPTAEVCDGIDNDCQNGVDDGLGPIPSDNVKGACSGNTKVCDGQNGYVNSPANYVPKTELCDGLDDGCNGTADDGLGPIPAANVAGACSGNKKVCAGASGYVNDPNNYVPVAEVCDGIDNDCKGGIDDGLGPIAAANVAGACKDNTRICRGVSGYVDNPANYEPVAEVCDGIDNDCKNGVDDGLPELPSDNVKGACAGNRKVCAGKDGYVAKAGNYVPASTDATCDGKDDDCDGTADEDYVADASCFKPGVCAAGNVPSTCSNGGVTACKTGAPAAQFDQCQGADDNCDGTVDTVCFNQITNNQYQTCGGCYKDLFAGRYYYCNGSDPQSNKSDCDWDGNVCTFPAMQNVSAAQCRDLCRNEPGCEYFTAYNNGACNLHLMTVCNRESTQAAGSIYDKVATCVPIATTDVTCDGIDDDCDGTADDDYVADTSCFKPGVCAAGNQASKCVYGKVVACKPGEPTGANDMTCDGRDDDCDGQTDEDWAPDTACFRQGVCAAGNVASTCSGGIPAACKTGAPASSQDLCQGNDDNCDGKVDTVCFDKLTDNQQKTCGGCTKDLFAGRYVYCNGTYPTATKTGCDWSGNDCTFPANKSVTATQCQELCRNEPGCYFATSYYDSICNLHLMTTCDQSASGAPGSIYEKQVSCRPTAANDVTCDGVDDDCDGQIDEDWVPDSSCFKSGVCAAGNRASSCTRGVLTACKTGAAAPTDLCQGQDDDCDGKVSTTCFTQVTTNEKSTCAGCYKDMYAGQYVYCNGTYADATKSGCDWVGGGGACTFPANRNVTAAQCQQMCEDEPGCYFFTSYSNSICNLHLMRACTRQTSGATGSIYKKNVACIPLSQTDVTCDGVDDDCDGQIDEDWRPDSSCFKPGVCAAGNAASTCNGGVLTACKTGAPTSQFDQCQGKDDNCDGTTETACWTEVSHDANQTCAGCYKDLYAGQYVYCNGTFPGATKSNCAWVGGAGDCTFPRETAVTREQCRQKCEAEPGCSYFTSYYDSICNLHLMTRCEPKDTSATGSVYASPSACVPVAANDVTCDGRDDDCDGAVDEDYVPDTSCFKPGVCAAGNVASKCANGAVTACKTGSPTSFRDLCGGQDDNCDGRVDTVCFTQVTNQQPKTCAGCRKDMAAGAYLDCNGAFSGATKSGCPSASGGAGCTFTPSSQVTENDCLDLCEKEAGCYFVTSVGDAKCTLHLMNACTQITGTSGDIFRKDGCIPTSTTDTTCDGKDDDCDGVADDDYVPDTSCFKPGVCAADNVASKCAFGAVTACKTGAPTSTTDLCGGKDDNCDGKVTPCVDTDGDGVPDDRDLCMGDDASGDTDGDGICDDIDNCRTVANRNQADRDHDGIGDACDNCPDTASADQADDDRDGVGNVCDPDFKPPSSAPKNTKDSRGCGFTPECPASSYNPHAYLFSCYDEACLGDRWWYLLNRRIYPMMVGKQPANTTEGFLDELERPEYNAPAQTCASSSSCPSGASCEDGVCLFPAVKSFIDRLTYASDFLSCTGTESYENTWPSSRVTKLDAGPCGWQTFGWKDIYGYRVENTMSEPMTIWVGRGAGSSTNDADKRWWTLYPGESIKFNSYDVAYVFPTGAAAYNACMPSFMTKTVYGANMTPPNLTQVSPMPLVKYEAAGGGALTIYRDRYLKTDFDLFDYPNYFGVGLGPKGTNGNKPLHGFMAVAIPPSVGARYSELTCL